MNIQRIGRYEIKRELGRGGMAAVYLAYDPAFEREVAVKLLPPFFLHDPNSRSRFEREAKIIASLEHPAIVPVYDYGEDNGQLFIVMRMMPGGSLEDHLAAGKVSIAEMTRIVGILASGLDEAHRRGIVHRDLKPANILFDNHNHPYVSDFGIAKRVEGDAEATSGKSIIGTPAYMSPEQARGDKDLDGRSDIYALGCMVYEMLTGERPYNANHAMALALKHIYEPVPDVRLKRPDLPPGYQQIIACAMAKLRGSRYATAEAFADDLQTILPLALDATRPRPDAIKFISFWSLATWAVYAAYSIVSGVAFFLVLQLFPSANLDELADRSTGSNWILQTLLSTGFGLLLGLLQGLIMRGRLKGWVWWMLATPFTMPGVVLFPCAPLIAWFAGFLGQWLILRRQVRNAILWVPASMLSWFITFLLSVGGSLLGGLVRVAFGATGFFPVTFVIIISVISILISGCVLGLLTGITMHWMLNRPAAHHIRLRLTGGPTV